MPSLLGPQEDRDAGDVLGEMVRKVARQQTGQEPSPFQHLGMKKPHAEFMEDLTPDLPPYVRLSEIAL